MKTFTHEQAGVICRRTRQHPRTRQSPIRAQIVELIDRVRAHLQAAKDAANTPAP